MSSVTTTKIPSLVSSRTPPTLSDMPIVNVYSRGNREAVGVVKGLKSLMKPSLLVYERMKKRVATTKEEKEERK